MEALKAKYYALYDKYVSAGFYKAASWISSVLAVVAAVGPDLVDALISNWTAVDSIPTLSVQAKATLLLGVHVLNILVLKPLQQKSVRAATLKQAVKTEQVTSEPGSESVDVNVKP